MAKPWDARIRNARTTPDQIDALRALKNEIIGHPLKKKVLVAQGVLDPLVRLCYNRTTNRQDGKSHDHTFASRPLAEEEVVRLQGLQAVASFALGGPSFLAPLQSVSFLSAVLSNLCPAGNPSSLVLAALRVLSNVADAAALSSSIHPPTISSLAEALFSRQHLNSLCRILSQTSSASTVQTQISLAASLISRLCREERHQQSLASSGVLDALATKLASFAVAGGYVIPGAELLAQREGIHEYIPLSAPRNANLSVILEALSVVIANSKFRASQLLYSPSILAIFPMAASTESLAPQNARAAWNAFNLAGLSGANTQLNAVDYLLPYVPLHQLKSVSSQAFPPLGASSRDYLLQNGRSIGQKYNSLPLPSWNDPPSEGGITPPDTSITEAEEPESPLIAYLILVLRARTGLERLMAAAVLTVLYRAGLTNKTRETAIGLLVVPLLVQMLDDEVVTLAKVQDDTTSCEATSIEWALKERVPAILAMLITDSEYLQKAAFDANAVSKLSKMLKMAYDPVFETADAQQWSPHDEDSMEVHEQSPSSRLGHQGQAPLLAHRIRVRESVLKAVASIAPFKDEYRKSIGEHGMIPYIVESLSPNPGKPSPKGGDKSESVGKTSKTTSGLEKQPEGYGKNPIEVLTAACHAVRALSRSVSILRTTLIDAGVGTPLFRLLTHPDIEVQIAATATTCNLVVDFSPMRQTFQEAGVLKILCEHAHSMNAKLRLNALWALKHFVTAVDNEMKRQCLEELGQGWLVQLICDDTEDEARKSDHPPPPYSNDDMDEDTEMDQFEEQMDSSIGGSFARTNSSRPTSSRSKAIQQAEIRLAALKEAETNPAKKARKDDIAVQEQGLDFIRNLIGGPYHSGSSETTEMIDFLFSALGQDRVFDILASKLRPKVQNPFSRRSSAADTKVIPPQPEIVNSVLYIIVHLAASIPRHRQIVIAQTDLLKLLVPLFSHPNVDVRSGLCWLVHNLIWPEDSSDRSAAHQRALELKRLRFLDGLETLGQDPELNVRERAKSSIAQMILQIGS